MTRLTWSAGARLAAMATVALGLLAARSAHAQVMCNDASLVNPLIVSGSSAFEPTLKQFAVKLTAEATPTTIILATGSNASGSCTGVSTIVNATDLGGTAGRYYTLTGASITNNSCTFAAGQKADVAISDVFYESCASVAQPRPATIGDFPGPVQAMVFVVPKANTTTQYLTYKEAQTLYGCGAGGAVSPASSRRPASSAATRTRAPKSRSPRTSAFRRRCWFRESASPPAAPARSSPT